jgi:hypothetical protein
VTWFHSRDTLAVEVEVFGREGPGQIAFRQHLVAPARPVHHPTGFLYPLAFPIVGVGEPSGRCNAVLGVITENVTDIRDLSCSITAGD